MTASYEPYENAAGRTTSFMAYPLDDLGLAPPEKCSHLFRQYGTTLVGWDQRIGDAIPDGFSCFPDVVSLQALYDSDPKDSRFGPDYLFGPFGCPKDWTTGTFSVSGSTTSILCCHTDHTFTVLPTPSKTGEHGAVCKRDIPRGYVVTYASWEGIVESKPPCTTSTLTANIRFGGAELRGISIGRATTAPASNTATRTSNILSSGLPSGPLDTLPSNSPGLTATLTSASPTTTSYDLPPTGHHLSTPAKIGIGAAIGAFAFVAFMLGLCVFSWKKWTAYVRENEQRAEGARRGHPGIIELRRAIRYDPPPEGIYTSDVNENEFEEPAAMPRPWRRRAG